MGRKRVSSQRWQGRTPRPGTSSTPLARVPAPIDGLSHRLPRPFRAATTRNLVPSKPASTLPGLFLRPDTHRTVKRRRHIPVALPGLASARATRDSPSVEIPFPLTQRGPRIQHTSSAEPRRLTRAADDPRQNRCTGVRVPPRSARPGSSRRDRVSPPQKPIAVPGVAGVSLRFSLSKGLTFELLLTRSGRSHEARRPTRALALQDV